MYQVALIHSLISTLGLVWSLSSIFGQVFDHGQQNSVVLILELAKKFVWAGLVSWFEYNNNVKVVKAIAVEVSSQSMGGPAPRPDSNRASKFCPYYDVGSNLLLGRAQE